jgi:hypothetical protein
MAPGVAVTLTVLDPEGKPVEGARVTLDGHVPLRYSRAQPRGETDAAGRVRLEGLSRELRYSVQAAAWPPRKEVARFWASRWTPQDETIRLPRALSIEGVVRDERGTPVAGARVLAAHLDIPIFEEAWSDASAAFVVSSLPEGKYRVSATHEERMLKSVEHRIPAGTRGVVLVAAEDPRSDLTIQLSDWPADAGTVQAMITTEPAKTGMGHQRTAAVGPNGRARFPRLRQAERFALWIRLPARGLMAYLRDVQPRAEPHVVRLVSGGTLRGRARAAADATDLSVSVAGPGWSAAGPVSASGDFELVALPEGPVRLFLTGKRDGKGISTLRDATVGETVEVELR